MIPASSADFPLLVSRNAARDGIAAALRLYVGRGRRYSVKQLSNATGVKDRVIECAMVGADHPDCRPFKICELLSVASFLGPEFTTEWLMLAQQAAIPLPGQDEPDPGELAADVADDTATIVRAARDQHFDPDERRELHDVGARMISRGGQLIQLRAHG